MSEEKNHNQETEKIEKLFEAINQDWSNKEIDPNFVNNLKFQLKENYVSKSQKKSSWLSFLTQSRAWGGALAAIVVAVIVVQFTGITQVDLTEETKPINKVSETVKDEISTDNLKEKEELQEKLPSSPKKPEKLVEKQVETKVEQIEVEAQDDFKEEDVPAIETGASSEIPVMAAPTAVEDEEVNTTLIILNVSSINDAAEQIKASLSKIGGQTNHNLSTITDNSAMLEMSVPKGQIEATISILKSATTDGKAIGSVLLHSAASIDDRIYFELMLLTSE